MGNYYRFKDPAYHFFGGESFPGTSPGSIGGHTYNRANVEDEGTGAGGSANAEGVKTGGNPNDGTYWVAFGEDATSGNVNRGFRAITQCTDIIDDILRTSVPKWTQLSVPNPAANSYQISGDVFVGDDVSMPASELMRVLSYTGNRSFNGLTPILINDIDNGTPGSSVIGAGWATNPTVRFSATVNENIVLFFGSRSSSARIVETEREAIWKGLMRVFMDANNAWSMRSHGLDERYRRANTITDPDADFGAGNGATITRDGQAVQVDPIDGDWTSTRQPDPFLSLYKTGVVGVPVGLAHDDARSGEMGYLAFDSKRHSTSDAGELSHRQRPYGAFVAFNPRDVDASTIGGETAYTRIHGAAANATLNKTGGGGNDYITLEGSNYFRNGGKTAIHLGKDVLLVTFSDNSQQAYRIWEFFSDTEVRVRSLGGSSLVSFPADESVRVDWLQLSFVAGGGEQGTPDQTIPPLGWYAPTKLADKNLQNPGVTQYFHPPEFIGVVDPSTPSVYVTRYGYHDPDTGFTVYTGNISSTGDFYFGRGEQRGAFSHRATGSGSSASSYTLDLDPYATEFSGVATYQSLSYDAAAALDAPQTLNVNWVSSSSTGSKMLLLIRNVNGCNLTINWDSTFVFSGQDAVGPRNAGEAVLWVGNHLAGKMYMTRTDYF